MPLLPKAARAALHFWEEPCISGAGGSGTIFFSGCALRCVFCQNREISQGGQGKVITTRRLAEIMRELEEQGAENINLVTPSHYVAAIVEALSLYRPHIPVVYNSGGYDSLEALQALRGLVDIYLFDLKYLSSDRARLYSGAADYPSTAVAAILEGYAQQPHNILQNGVMQKGMIVRHLLLPQGTREAMAVFDWVRQNTPGAAFSLMSQYLPCGKAESMPPIDRRVTAREYDKVLDYILASGFENVYIQERESARGEYIPCFDGTGI